MTEADDYLPISSLNQYVYCPKSAWYQFVTGQFRETADVVEGGLLHERADSAERTVLGDLVQIRTVWLYSRRYRLIGIADLIEQTARELYPVEYKKGAPGDWKNHQVQLCAQALCLEEMYGLRRPIRRGFLYYAQSGRRQPVKFNRALRARTIRTIKAVRRLFETQQRPRVGYSRKCPCCALYPICLPKEVAILNKRR
jgi:CRISPR-associated exonuclease Cas4